MSSILVRLKDILAIERRALLEHNADLLMSASKEKLECIQLLGEHPPTDAQSDLRALAEANLANGRLLARRRHEVNWALRNIDNDGKAASYNQDGTPNHPQSSFPIGIV